MRGPLSNQMANSCPSQSLKVSRNCLRERKQTRNGQFGSGNRLMSCFYAIPLIGTVSKPRELQKKKNGNWHHISLNHPNQHIRLVLFLTSTPVLLPSPFGLVSNKTGSRPTDFSTRSRSSTPPRSSPPARRGRPPPQSPPAAAAEPAAVHIELLSEVPPRTARNGSPRFLIEIRVYTHIIYISICVYIYVCVCIVHIQTNK